VRRLLQTLPCRRRKKKKERLAITASGDFWPETRASAISSGGKKREWTGGARVREGKLIIVSELRKKEKKKSHEPEEINKMRRRVIAGR